MLPADAGALQSLVIQRRRRDPVVARGRKGGSEVDFAQSQTICPAGAGFGSGAGQRTAGVLTASAEATRAGLQEESDRSGVSLRRRERYFGGRTRGASRDHGRSIRLRRTRARRVRQWQASFPASLRYWSLPQTRLDDDSGVGTQFVVGDANGDGLPDIEQERRIPFRAATLWQAHG